jgi:hypothetical protein
MEMPEPQEDVMAEEVETEVEPMGLMSRGTE